VEHLDEGDHVIHDDVGAQDTQGLDADSPAMMNDEFSYFTAYTTYGS
jgi:hypothetical protein